MTAAPPILMLAEGRRPRPRKAPVLRPREIALHVAVATVLREHCLPDWKYFHVPNGEPRDIRTAAKLKSLGVVRGIPDFVLISPHGSVRFLELKRLGEKLSDVQDDFRLHCIAHGIPHVIARTIDDALAAFSEWRCLRIIIPMRTQTDATVVIGCRS